MAPVTLVLFLLLVFSLFFFKAEDGIRVLVRSRGLGDLYKRQPSLLAACTARRSAASEPISGRGAPARTATATGERCLLYTSDAADERSSVDLGGRRIIKKKNNEALLTNARQPTQHNQHDGALEYTQGNV